MTVSSTCFVKCQRVTCALTLLNFPCEWQRKPLSFLFRLQIRPFPHPPHPIFLSYFSYLLSITAYSRFISSSVPLLKPKNHLMHLSVSVIPHTHTRDATLLLTTAGDHLARVCMRESVCFALFVIMHSVISLRGVISLPLRALFPSLWLSLLASLKLFCVCWYHSDEKSRTKVFLSACPLL